MKIGDIICHREIIFNDGKKDVKEKRPCIFLFGEFENGEYITYSIPLSSQVKQFNKYPDKYVFIPEQIYGYKKLSFAKVDGIIKTPSDGVILTDKKVSLDTVKNIVARLKNIEFREKINFYDYLMDVLMYIESFGDLRQEKSKRKRKK